MRLTDIPAAAGAYDGGETLLGVKAGAAALLPFRPAPSFGARVALMGDSITAYNDYVSGSNTGNGLSGYLTHLNWISGQRFVKVGLNKGVSGNSTSQMLARYDADIAANYSQFDILFLLGGTNDFVYGQTGPTVSYPRSIPKETTLANLQAMALKALAAGKTVVLFTVPPRAGTGWNPITDSTSITNLTREKSWVNQHLRDWKRSLAPTVPLYLVDITRALTDPANARGDFNLAYSVDGVHPTGKGA